MTTPKVLRIDGPLFFADADRVRTRIQELTGQNGSLTKVVIDAESVHLTETDGVDIRIQVARGSDSASVAPAQVHPTPLALGAGESCCAPGGPREHPR